jgi:hypothetical protein
MVPPQALVMEDKTEKVGRYISSDVKVQLPKHDADVTLFLPNGEPVLIQWRLDGPSLDVCFATEYNVHAFQGDDLKPADRVFDSDQHVRNAKQLMASLPESVLGK